MQGHCKVQRLSPLPRESLGKTKPGRPNPQSAIRLWRKGLLQRLFFYRNLSESFFVTAIVANWNGSVIFLAVGKGKYSDAVCLSSIQFGHLRYHENMYLWSSDIRFCKIQTLFKEVALICNYGCASNRHAQICTRKQWGEVYRFGCFNSDKPWAPWTGDADTGVTWQLFTPIICGIWNSLLSDPNNSILPLIKDNKGSCAILCDSVSFATVMYTNTSNIVP